MPLAFQILTRDKTMVSMSDYGDEYHMLKKLAVGHLLNINTQVGSNWIYKEVRTVVCLLMFVYIHLLLSTCALKDFPMHVCDHNIVWQKQNRPIRENALFNMLDALFLDLKNTSPHSGGSVIDVRDYIKRAVFPFSMFQVMIIIKHSRVLWVVFWVQFCDVAKFGYKLNMKKHCFIKNVKKRWDSALRLWWT